MRAAAPATLVEMFDVHAPLFISTLKFKHVEGDGLSHACCIVAKLRSFASHQVTALHQFIPFLLIQ